MDLCAIDGSNIDDAVRLLCEGFPRQSADFWETGLDRARGCGPDRGTWPLGYLLETNGEPAGVMLTFAGRRRLDSADRRAIVNLSSLYVAPGHRALTPLMLVRVLSDKTAVYTDLTAAPSLSGMLERLGFTSWSHGLALFLWPFLPRSAKRRGRVVLMDEAPPGALHEEERRLLEDHASLGCIPAVLEYDSGWMPLLFRRTTLKRIPAGHLIYAPDRRVVLQYAAAASRFLRRRGMPLLTMDAREEESAGGGFYRAGRVRWFRGDLDPNRIDYAYSELVYLNLPPY